MQDRLDRNTLVLPSPAKLNLMLHILGRREDGYHELQTLFQFLDYGDEMTFAVRDDGIICLHTDFPGVAHDDNLIVKAAKKLQVSITPPAARLLGERSITTNVQFGLSADDEKRSVTV